LVCKVLSTGNTPEGPVLSETWKKLRVINSLSSFGTSPERDGPPGPQKSGAGTYAIGAGVSYNGNSYINLTGKKCSAAVCPLTPCCSLRYGERPERGEETECIASLFWCSE
jgi:hypothetical protein